LSTRPRHGDKSTERLLQEAERKGWRVVKPGGHFKMYCPCPDKHLKTVSSTPSDPNYLRNLLGELRRKTCWEAKT
jgi:hypothetical protein